MTDHTRKVLWIAGILLAGFLVGRIPAQTINAALPPQHQVAPRPAPPVRPAITCRVFTNSGPVTGWKPCSKAHRTAQRLTEYGRWAWVERKNGGKP